MMHIEFPLYLANSKDWYTLTVGRKHVMKTELVVSFQCEFKEHTTRKEMTGDGKRTITTVMNIKTLSKVYRKGCWLYQVNVVLLLSRL